MGQYHEFSQWATSVAAENAQHFVGQKRKNRGSSQAARWATVGFFAFVYSSLLLMLCAEQCLPSGALDVQPWTLIVQRRFYSDQAGGNSAKEEPKSNLQKVEEKKTALVASRVCSCPRNLIPHQRKSKLTPQSDSWNYQGRRLWLICITWLRCDYIYWYVNIRGNLTLDQSLRIAYSLFHGLFSSASPQAIYSSTCDIIKNDSEVSFKTETRIGNADNINKTGWACIGIGSSVLWEWKERLHCKVSN